MDDDGRVHMYRGSSNVHPIYGVEIDPDNYFLPVGENRELFNLEPDEHGWERFGENHNDTETKPFIEGAWMNKHNGRYYLQYAAPGTELNVYGDTTYRLNGLNAAPAYYFAVEAFNENGISERSAVDEGL